MLRSSDNKSYRALKKWHGKKLQCSANNIIIKRFQQQAIPAFYFIPIWNPIIAQYNGPPLKGYWKQQTKSGANDSVHFNFKDMHAVDGGVATLAWAAALRASC